MNFDYISLKNKIIMYLNKEITLYELGKICENVYYDIIKGEYIYLNKLLIYPLLKTLYRINIDKNDITDEFPCNESEILNIYDILAGNKKYSYLISIGFPKNISKNILEEYNEKASLYECLKRIFLRYLEDHLLNYDGYLLIQKLSLYELKTEYTIFDILDNYIITFIKNIVVESNNIEIMGKLSLYSKQRITQDYMIKRIICCIDCYIGKSNIDAQIIFDSGQPRLNTMIISF